MCVCECVRVLCRVVCEREEAWRIQPSGHTWQRPSRAPTLFGLSAASNAPSLEGFEPADVLALATCPPLPKSAPGLHAPLPTSAPGLCPPLPTSAPRPGARRKKPDSTETFRRAAEGLERAWVGARMRGEPMARGAHSLGGWGGFLRCHDAHDEPEIVQPQQHRNIPCTSTA